MNPAIEAQLISNLKALKLSAVLGHLDAQLRQARESKEDYAEFLLNLSELEVTTRLENGRKRRIREARFPLMKPIEDEALPSFQWVAGRDKVCSWKGGCRPCAIPACTSICSDLRVHGR
jgi:hypothetical protein